MKQDNGAVLLTAVLVGTVAFFVGALLARALPNWHPKPLVDLLVASIGAFAGTVGGAWIALTGEKRRRQQATEDANISAANLAVFELGRISNFFLMYQRHVIEPNRNSPIRWLLLARYKLPQGVVFGFDFPSLAFLFSIRGPAVLALVALELERYQTVAYMITAASEALSLRAHPRMEAAGIGDGVSLQQIETALGVRVVAELRTLTDGIVDHVDRNIISVFSAAAELRAAALSIYPHRRVLALEIPEIDSESAS